MTPILYAKTETRFRSNGLGRLSDAMECYVEEERNATFELRMTYPRDGIHFESIEEECWIKTRSCPGGKPQLFRIYSIIRKLDDTVEIKAEHISYLMSRMVVMPFTASTCAQALAMIPSHTTAPCPFSFATDKDVTASFNMAEPRELRGMLGGEQGSILDVFGTGEYEFDNYDVILHLHRGVDSGVTLRYGKNITDLEDTTDLTNTYVGIVPFWRNDTDIVTLPEGVIYSGHEDAYVATPVKVVDFSDQWQEAPSVETLRSRAAKYLADNEGWLPGDNLKVSFIALWDTDEYKNVAALQRANLCDTVYVVYEKLGVKVKAQIVKTRYNALLDRYDSLEVGNAQNDLGRVISEGVAKDITPMITSHMELAINHATDLISGGLGGHVIFNRDANGKPNEILIMDTEDKNTATQVLRINLNGIGFGKSYNGPFTTAWTLDGHFVANFIDTGTLTADIIRAGVLCALNDSHNYWNMVSGEFVLTSLISDEGIVYKNGVLIINASVIKAGIIQAQQGNSYWNMNTGELVLDANASLDGETVSGAKARISANAQAITSEVTRATTAEGTLSSAISQTATEVRSEVTRATAAEGELGSLIQQTADRIYFSLQDQVYVELDGNDKKLRLGANQFVVNSTNFKLDEQGNLTISGRLVTCESNRTDPQTGETKYTNIDNGKLETNDIVARNGYFSGTVQASLLIGNRIYSETETGSTTIEGNYILSQSSNAQEYTGMTSGALISNNLTLYGTAGDGYPALFFRKDENSQKAKGIRWIPANAEGEHQNVMQFLGHCQFLSASEPPSHAEWSKGRIYVEGDSYFQGKILPGAWLDIGASNDFIDALYADNVVADVALTVNGDTGDSLVVKKGDIRVKDGTIYTKDGQVHTSDRNHKHDINRIDERYEKMYLALEPVKYIFNDGVRTHIGLISQDVAEQMHKAGISNMEYAVYCADPETTYNEKGEKIPLLDENGDQVYTHKLRYEEFIGLNMHMVQKAYKRIETLEDTVSQMSTIIEDLKREVAALKGERNGNN